jgi:AraC family transcriptional regulator of adaptative response/methylated-DNA-[protein]-cysteine methyltransferase
MTHYETAARALAHIAEHRLEHASLEETAAALGMTPDAFRKLFTKWVGVTPTQFGRYLTLVYAKELLTKGTPTLSAATQAGLSSGSRLHDAFVEIEAMTPGTYAQGGRDLALSYTVFGTPFGRCLAAASDRGITNVLFADSDEAAVQELRNLWPNAILRQRRDPKHAPVRKFLSSNLTPTSSIKLHLRGTNFQLKVWEALLSIPEGGVRSYRDIASAAGSPKSMRAAGNAIGGNPVAFLIPCHRVLRSSGALGGYRWGTDRKRVLFAFEAMRRETYS